MRKPKDNRYPFKGVHRRLRQAVKDFLRGYRINEAAERNRVDQDDLEETIRAGVNRAEEALEFLHVELVATGYKGFCPAENDPDIARDQPFDAQAHFEKTEPTLGSTNMYFVSLKVVLAILADRGIISQEDADKTCKLYEAEAHKHPSDRGHF